MQSVIEQRDDKGISSFYELVSRVIATGLSKKKLVIAIPLLYCGRSNLQPSVLLCKSCFADCFIVCPFGASLTRNDYRSVLSAMDILKVMVIAGVMALSSVSVVINSLRLRRVKLSR